VTDIISSIKDLMVNLPKRETWVLTNAVPEGIGEFFETATEKFVVLNEATWNAVLRSLPKAEEPIPMLFQVTATVIDPQATDCPSMAIWRANLRDRVMRAREITIHGATHD